ncbi:MAG: hypothetical protein QOE90_2535 [Thermoplasmata archaeon]|jgi:hypothetical protein|nr:hypothetical protein [Thermoplasmata archaeon]
MSDARVLIVALLLAPGLAGCTSRGGNDEPRTYYLDTALRSDPNQTFEITPDDVAKMPRVAAAAWAEAAARGSANFTVTREEETAYFAVLQAAAQRQGVVNMTYIRYAGQAFVESAMVS